MIFMIFFEIACFSVILRKSSLFEELELNFS